MPRAATVYSDVLDGHAGRVRCQLVVVDGPDRGRACRLGVDEVVIGTDAGVDLELSDDRVSARHLALRVDGARFAVRDLGSTNGTWFEGSRVSELVVPAGTTLRVGRSALRIELEAQALDVAPSQARRFGELVAESLAMREVFAVLERVAATDATVLVEGETGTGKEVVARAVHDASARRRGPFVAVDCGALPEGLLESELFGHVRGAFTGAAQARDGTLVRADGGTLFLDELGRVTPAVQARLLRVLEERVVRPLGGDRERAVDVRIIAASRDDLDAEVAAGRFRADLMYRLAVVRVALPPLRTRREDVPLLVRELLRRRGLTDEAPTGPGLDRLLAHGWPGNVRELRNVLDRALALAPGARRFTDLAVRIEPGAAAPVVGDGLPVRSDLPYAEAKALVLHELERRYLADVLARAGGNLSAAARAADLDRKHLRTLARRHGLIDDDGDGD
ncbi:MAG: sigma 54-dependent Fis family transcriptional regulator [Kofleriaceae bacterium]|nr:sigma 54-dependent Fis family transcriptional regulator [Kofleriaceae bacterium]MBP6839853.1 sigma 54-dependent Fis family transcriptional regulator [Kofleriaceae bacterium]